MKKVKTPRDFFTKEQRIIDNLFDIMLQTSFAKTSQKQLSKDIRGSNIEVDYTKQRIQIQDCNGQRVLYTISIKKGE